MVGQRASDSGGEVMNDASAREFALKESDKMRILASEYRQLGLKELARFLEKNANNALLWSQRVK